ncbi:MAG: 2-hydroxyacid dehydrogenase [Gammaproteobacteria bacterium]|nr:2-hydroxyacid dehydrogenase [Gammaproteobacteria bacterium]
MTEKDHVLLVSQNIEDHLDEFGGRCEFHRYYNAQDKEALLDEVGSKIRIVGTNGHDGCSREMMDKLPNLEMIGCYGVGYDAIDIDAAREKGVRVTNTPDVLSDAVAELAVGLMIALARQIPQSDRFVRDGKWTPANGYPLTTELTGRTVGILGLGRIGQEIANRLQAMKMRVIYHGRNQQLDKPYVYYDDLEAMARDSDWLVVIMPGGPGTSGIVSESVMRALGSNGNLVNVGRGPLVDEAALVKLLESGDLGGAALDVFAKEPSIPDALINMHNVVLSPHAASATVKTRLAMGSLVIANILAHLNGRPLITQVA